jgi:hypothetical protein
MKSYPLYDHLPTAAPATRVGQVPYASSSTATPATSIACVPYADAVSQHATVACKLFQKLIKNNFIFYIIFIFLLNAVCILNVVVTGVI